MNWRLLIEGAAAAALGGAVNQVALVPDGASTTLTLKIVGAGAVIGLFGYLKKNARKPDRPPPPPEPQADPPPDPGPQI